tara:strand:+ start:208 stop:450 length:243 start_codon:yes stop_codon:yes gene_type:complete
MSNWWRGGHKEPPKGEPISTGFVDNFVDDILTRYGITEETVKGVTKIVDSIVKNVSVKEIGDETFITIHIKDIHFKFKKK